MEKPFQIFRVGALTQQVGRENERCENIKIFYITLKFLQDNGLAVRNLINGIEDVTDEFILTSADVTAEGLTFMRAGWQKWLAKIDSGMSPDDVSILDKALKRIRGS